VEVFILSNCHTIVVNPQVAFPEDGHPRQEPSLPIDPSTAFVSYSREDLEFVLRLAKDLKAKGAMVWMDKLDIRPGKRWEIEIETAVDACSRMLVILSPAAITSKNVLAEASLAIDEGKEVIPVLYRECKIPFRLRPFQYADFQTDYALGLDDLLTSLTAKGAGEAAIAEQARLEEERRQAAEQTRLEQQEPERQGEAEKGRRAEEGRRTSAEQARLEEERRQAVEEARLQKERRAAEERGQSKGHSKERLERFSQRELSPKSVYFSIMVIIVVALSGIGLYQYSRNRWSNARESTELPTNTGLTRSEGEMPALPTDAPSTSGNDSNSGLHPEVVTPKTTTLNKEGSGRKLRKIHFGASAADAQEMGLLSGSWRNDRDGSVYKFEADPDDTLHFVKIRPSSSYDPELVSGLWQISGGQVRITIWFGDVEHNFAISQNGTKLDDCRCLDTFTKIQR
jgi:hypothetical protein